MKFIFLSFKRNILPMIFVLLAICLVLFSKSNLVAAKNGLTLWATNVVPSLFPFFVVTELLATTNVVYYLGKWLDKIMRPVFGVPGEGAFAFIMGLMSGYPVGGKIVTRLRQEGLCTKEEGDRMLAFTNNSGPLFIISSVGVSLFGDTRTGFLLLATHILACITVGIILARLSAKKHDFSTSVSTTSSTSFSQKKKPIRLGQLGELLGKSIYNATSTIMMIGGFVILFSVLISILEHSHCLDYGSQFLTPLLKIFGFDIRFAKPILSGIIELTNGVNLVSHVAIKSISENVILCAFLLGFGGFSVLLQVFSLLANTDLSIKTYFIGKLMQGIIAAFYTFLALKFLPFLNLDIAPTCAPIAETIVYPVSFLGISNYVLLLLILVLIVCFVFCSPHQRKYDRKTSIK